MDQEYMEIKDVATLLGVSPNALAMYRTRSEGPPYIKLHQRRVLYRRSDVMDWLDSRLVTPGSKR